jgi:hypothetical protein
MAVMEALAAVRTASPIIHQVGAAWFFAETTLEAGKTLGMPNGFAWYVAGRGGVLGPEHPAVIAAAFGFFNPDLVAKMWGAGTGTKPATEVGALYAGASADFGRAHFGNFPGAARAVELTQKLIDAAPTMGRVLFTGWKAFPRPSDAAGALELNLQTLRELRGDAHIQAVAVQGLTAVEAIVAQEGPDRAKRFGWAEPYPDRAALADRWQQAEHLTDDMMAATHRAAFSDAELLEFVGLMQQVPAFVTPAGA